MVDSINACDIINLVNDKTKDLIVAKTPLSIRFTGKLNTPLEISVDTPDNSYDVIILNQVIEHLSELN